MWGRKTVQFLVSRTILFCLIAKLASSWDPCIQNFNRDLCMREATCENLIILENLNIDDHLIRKCYNSYFYRQWSEFPMKIIYEDTSNEYSQMKPNVDIDDHCHLIISLELSHNNYTIFPLLQDMQNLEMLNLSFNSIYSAVLSSEYSFPKLQELDLSHNLIHELKTNGDEYAFTNLLKLNISHNNLVDLDPGFFQTFNYLQYIDLSYNEISNLNKFAFEGVSNLVYLNIGHNRLKEFSGSLVRLTKLEHIHADNNKFGSLLQNDFGHLISLKTIYFNDNLITQVEHDLFNDMQYLYTVNLKNNLIKNLDENLFSNTHSLQNVDFSFNEIQAIPKFMFKDNNISIFNIQRNNIGGALVRGTFEGLFFVTELDLSFQNLDFIEDYAFVGLSHVEELFLNNNRIKNVSLKSFNNMYTLKRLDLSNNLITTLGFHMDDLIKLKYLLINKNIIGSIKKDDFHGLHVLQFLDVSHNNISQIESYSFKDMDQLNSFDISKNLLANTLQDNAFYGLKSLPVLEISYSSLNIIQNNSFNGMFNLHTLNISHGAITEITYNALINTDNINVLDLSFNMLKYFDLNTTALVKLRDLYLHHNLISSISHNTFAGMPLLTRINLSFNYIKQLQDIVFLRCKDISYLDISYNREIVFNISLIENLHFLENIVLSGITKDLLIDNIANSHLIELHISNSSITHITSLGINNFQFLKILDLSHNKITFIDAGAFNKLYYLYALDLSFNRLKSLPIDLFKENINLNVLNISHNQLATPGYGAFHGLTSLETLDLSHNEIQDLKTERFYDIPNLRILIVDFNNISKISFEEFSNQHLSILSIGGNALPCEMLVKFKRSKLTFNITAKIRENIKENIHGITCSGDEPLVTMKSNVNDSILVDIRNVLVKLSMDKSNVEITKSLVNHNFNSINDRLKDLVVENNITNTLLERFLQSGEKMMISKTTSNLNSYKVDNNGYTTTENMSYLHASNGKVDKTINAINEKISIMNTTMNESFEHITSEIAKNSNSVLFTDICVGLLLTIVLCFTAYKIYETFILTPTRRSYSTHEIIVPMDNSHV
ncbi:slit homolog 3 protein-like [Zerene cesonia]|uniref:slit homolog 3 protein-like n=1 Tax=Zerene cesonia TaxID=33412 RepID=UPI0018E4DF56|nr:slit homolog 3 protein-like [Zerene cesonia]